MHIYIYLYIYITTSVSFQLFEGSSKVSTNCSGRILILLTIAFLFLAALGKTQLCMKRVKSEFIFLQDISFLLVVVKYVEYSGRR